MLVGVPEITPVEALIERPAGRVGETVYVAAPPVLVGVRELIATVGANVIIDGEYAIAGGAMTAIVTVAVDVPPAYVAVTV